MIEFDKWDWIGEGEGFSFAVDKKLWIRKIEKDFRVASDDVLSLIAEPSSGDQGWSLVGNIDLVDDGLLDECAFSWS